MVFAEVRACCAGVVVFNVTPMFMAVVPIFESFYQQGGGSNRGLVACVAAAIAPAAAATTAAVAATTAIVAAATVPIAATAAAKIAAPAAVVSAFVSAITMILAAAPPVARAAWLMLLVLDGRRRLAGSNCLT
jgi:hypothetical protein